MTAPALLAFAGLCAILAVTPGPDTFLVLRYSLARPGAGLSASAGSAVGSMLWALAVALGLAALLEQSAEIYRVVKIAGGLYLLYLGVAALIASRRKAAHGPEGQVRTTTLRSGFLAGMLSTLMNPKVGLFFVAIAPQFVPRDGHAIGNTLLLGGIDAAVGSAYLCVVALLASRAVAWLKKPSVTRALERISAAILAALGIGTIALSAAE
ncbi:LysE family translocator [Leifsonia shinshuensis]|uniref:Threonine/homoserine/homoserine lactone efflux protein n=1 Tax=Leifsonia shinshuensis TaxID=150026 RepID=A0A853CX29_9MICO|nr:LysE family translocator [Leifsonia shinshuensis]NYJ25666.1 threonine/homoserine/homoserine lactone efflux protein [Leifsonia shinshuensis]